MIIADGKIEKVKSLASCPYIFKFSFTFDIICTMKKKYDFTNGIRGKFFSKEATFEIPVYLEPQNEVFVRKIAEDKKMTLSEIVNQLISKNKELVSIVGSH